MQKNNIIQAEVQQNQRNPRFIAKCDEQFSCKLTTGHKIPRRSLEMCNLKKMKTFQ